LPPLTKIIANNNNKCDFDDSKESVPGCSWQKNIYYINEPSNKFENTRYSELEKCLRMEQINIEEKEHVQTLVKKHENLFKLPSKPLTLTDKISHKINTTDNAPINVK
jgi:hypothetical protein